jgi:hypothetical protein
MHFTLNLLNIHHVYKVVYSFSGQSRSDWVPMPQNPNLTEVFDRFGFSFPVKDSPHAYGVPAPYEPEYRSVEPGFQPAPQYGFPHGAKLPPVLPPAQQIQVTAGRRMTDSAAQFRVSNFRKKTILFRTSHWTLKSHRREFLLSL